MIDEQVFYDYGTLKMIKEYKDRQRVRSYEKTDIKQGFGIIQGQKVTFKERLLMGDTLKMILPQSYREMGHFEKKCMYGQNQVPEYVYTNGDSNMYLSLEYVMKGSTTEQLDSFKEQLKDMILKEKSIWTLNSSETIQVNEKSVTYFDIYSIEEDSYQFLFFETVKVQLQKYNEILAGVFFCSYNKQEEWGPIFVQMIESITNISKRVTY